MDATTNLKFTLTSDNPNPNPDVPVTPVTPSSTTTITPTSPNTGDNTAEGNVGGTVFGALFIIIGIAALLVFLAKYLKKNRRISFAERGSFHLSMRPRILATVSLCLAIAFLGGLMITKFTDTNPTNAMSKAVNVKASGSLTFVVDRGEIGVLSDTIEVENGGFPYDLYMYTDGNTKFCLSGSTDCPVNTVAGNITSTTGLSTMDTQNTWGISFLGEKPTDSIWGGAPTSTSTTAVKIAHKTGSETKTGVSYAVFVGSNLADGTYVAKVSYHAVAEIPDEDIYNVKTRQGYVGETGENDDEDFYEDEEVIIRPNCPVNTTFTGWKVNKSSLKVADIKQVEGKNDWYQFIMPAEDVIVEANCVPDGSWAIKYNANAPTGTTATGTMNQTDVTGTSATLRTNAFAITDYTFKGWACASGNSTDASKIKFTNQASVTEATLQAAGCNPQTSGGGEEEEGSGINTYTVYAIWQKNLPTLTYIQDVTPEHCDAMELFEVVKLLDRRVETQSEISGYTYRSDSLGKHIEYSFTRYADGRCWMLQDIAYQPGTSQVELNKDDTDVSETKNMTFATSGTGAAYHAPGSSYNGYSVLYNYKAATAGTYTTSTAANTTLKDSLCPASWKMPDAQNPSGQFGDQSGELYDMHHYNIGKANGGGKNKDTETNHWEKDTFLFKEKITLTAGSSSGTEVNAPYFKYSGAWDFVNDRYATNAGTDSPDPGAYASYFMSTVRSDGKVAAMNPHKTGSDQNILNGETDPGDGSSLRCVLRTAAQRTTRNAPVRGTDVTDSTDPARELATYNQTH